MPNPHTNARTLTHLRQAWQAHLDATDGQLTWDNAEEFLASAQEAAGRWPMS